MTKAAMKQKWMTLTLTFLGVIFGDDSTECPRPSVLRLGLLQPFEGELGFERTAAASTMAITDAQNLGILNGTEVR